MKWFKSVISVLAEKLMEGQHVGALPGESEAVFQKVFGPIVEQWHGREGPHNS